MQLTTTFQQTPSSDQRFTLAYPDNSSANIYRLPFTRALKMTALALSICLVMPLAVSAFFTVDCGMVANTREDPIVSPNVESRHVHVVAGSNGFSRFASHADLRSASCTSCDVQQDKSAYWTPQLYVVPPTLSNTSQDAITAAGGIPVPVRGGGLVIYYKFVTNRGERLNNDPSWERINPFPENFRMLIPEAMVLNVTRRTTNPQDRPVSYLCLGAPNQGTTLINFPDDPTTCTVGLRAQFTLPSCWNGKESDTQNHFSHMSYPTGSWQGSSCPSTHPVRVPTLFYEILYNTAAPAIAAKLREGWQLSYPAMANQYANPDNPSRKLREPVFHADFMNGWDQAFLARAMDVCGVTPCSHVVKRPGPTCTVATNPPPTNPPNTNPPPTPAPASPPVCDCKCR